MDDPSQLTDGVTITQFVMGTAMSLFAWVGKRQVKRIDDLETKVAQTVSVEQYNATLESLRRQIAEGNQGTHERIDMLMTTIVGLIKK